MWALQFEHVEQGVDIRFGEVVVISVAMSDLVCMSNPCLGSNADFIKHTSYAFLHDPANPFESLIVVVTDENGISFLERLRFRTMSAIVGSFHGFIPSLLL